jgi:hypothetical protein
MNQAVHAVPNRLHAFCDDALGARDTVAIAEQIARREISAREACAAAVARAAAVGALDAVACEDYERALRRADPAPAGPLSGVPTFIKDNVDVTGLPTRHGSAAVPRRPAASDGPFVQQFLAQGLVTLGKSRLPEFGFNATTEFAERDQALREELLHERSVACRRRAIPGIPTTPAALRPAAPRLWSPAVLYRSHMPMTAAGRSAFRQRVAVWSV